MPYNLVSDNIAATSDGSGNATFTFVNGPSFGRIWRGSVFVDQAPASASSRVTTGPAGQGGEPWGTTTGGGALLVEVRFGQRIQIVTTGLTINTRFTAWFRGSDVEEDAAIGVTGWLYPFPRSTV